MSICHKDWIPRTLSLLILVLVIAFGGIIVAPSEQVPATRASSASPATGPAAQSTPRPVPTAIARSSGPV